MSPEETLHAALIADAGVTSLVGAKIYVDDIPQNTERPVVAYQRDSTEIENLLSGGSVGEFVNIQVIIHADGRAEAEAIAAAVETPLIAAQFWKVAQTSGYEPEIDSNVVAVQYRYFHCE